MKEITVDYEKTRTEVASFLRSFADELERDERITLITGNDSATINPPEHLHFKVESESTARGPARTRDAAFG